MEKCMRMFIPTMECSFQLWNIILTIKHFYLYCSTNFYSSIMSNVHFLKKFKIWFFEIIVSTTIIEFQ